MIFKSLISVKVHLDNNIDLYCVAMFTYFIIDCEYRPFPTHRVNAFCPNVFTYLSMSVNSTFAGETKIHLATFETYEAKKCKGFFRVRTCSEKLNILDRHQCVLFRLFYNLVKRLLNMGNLSR